MKHVLALLMALGALVALGCAAGDSLNAFAVGPNECQTADQCGANRLCVEFRCVDATQAAGPDEVSIEVAPPPGSPYTPLHRLNVSLENAARMILLRVPVPIPYEVVVLDANGERIAAELTIYGAARIPGREVVHHVTVDAHTALGAQFSLVEGMYAARVRPLDASLPAFDVESFTVREGAVLPKEFRLPAMPRRLFGRVAQAQASDLPIAGAIVRAVGEKSQLESTVGTSDADGNYELLLPETNDTVFRVTAVLPPDQQPAWGFSESIIVEREGDRRLDIGVEVSSDDNRGTVALTIRGLDEQGLGTAIPNARVTLTATVANRLAPPVYEITGFTDGRGNVLVEYDGDFVDAVPLLRSRYLVDVIPPITSPFGRAQEIFDLRGAGQAFTLDRQVTANLRTTLVGDVASNFGGAVEGRIEIRPLDDALPPLDTVSDATGRFTLSIDPGDYLLVVRPFEDENARGELLPVGIQKITVPSGRTTYVLPPFRLPAGNVVTGAIQGGIEDEPVGAADVEMFVREEGLTISLGRTVTDDGGRFSVVLPVPR